VDRSGTIPNQHGSWQVPPFVKNSFTREYAVLGDNVGTCVDVGRFVGVLVGVFVGLLVGVFVSMRVGVQTLVAVAGIEVDGRGLADEQPSRAMTAATITEIPHRNKFAIIFAPIG